jgi:hypothetical protein
MITVAGASRDWLGVGVCTHTAPNKGLELTASSVRFAPASSRSSGPAFGERAGPAGGRRRVVPAPEEWLPSPQSPGLLAAGGGLPRRPLGLRRAPRRGSHSPEPGTGADRAQGSVWAGGCPPGRGGSPPALGACGGRRLASGSPGDQRTCALEHGQTAVAVPASPPSRWRPGPQVGGG